MSDLELTPIAALLQQWSGALWAGPTVLPDPVVGEQFPPPIPAAIHQRFDYIVNTGLQTWGVDGWAVPRDDPYYPGGGVLLAPQPDIGVMRLYAWWPDATLIHLIRVHPDGSRYAVRGATPRRVAHPTRRNFDQNPSHEAGINGLFPGAGDPLLSRVPRLDDPSGGAWAATNTIAAAGPSGFSRPVQPMAISQHAVTVSFDALFTALPSSVVVTVQWQDAAGSTLPAASTATLGADQLVQSVNQWGRQVAHLVPPDAAAVAGDVFVTAQDMPAGPSFAHDRWVLEEGHTDGAYVSGSIPGGQWTGVPELSSSLTADVQVVDDGECPLDIPVTYELFYAGLTVGLMRSRPASLAAPTGEYCAWLTHPARPATPIRLWVGTDPSLTRPIDRSTSKVMGRRLKVVRSDDHRSGDEGSLVVHTEGPRGTAELEDALADGRSVLLRSPDGFQHPPLWWLNFGDVDRDNPSGYAGFYRRQFTLPFIEVDAPSAIDFAAVP